MARRVRGKLLLNEAGATRQGPRRKVARQERGLQWGEAVFPERDLAKDRAAQGNERRKRMPRTSWRERSSAGWLRTAPGRFFTTCGLRLAGRVMSKGSIRWSTAYITAGASKTSGSKNNALPPLQATRHPLSGENAVELPRTSPCYHSSGATMSVSAATAVTPSWLTCDRMKDIGAFGLNVVWAIALILAIVIVAGKFITFALGNNVEVTTSLFYAALFVLLLYLSLISEGLVIAISKIIEYDDDNLSGFLETHFGISTGTASFVRQSRNQSTGFLIGQPLVSLAIVTAITVMLDHLTVDYTNVFPATLATSYPRASYWIIFVLSNTAISAVVSTAILYWFGQGLPLLLAKHSSIGFLRTPWSSALFFGVRFFCLSVVYPCQVSG